MMFSNLFKQKNNNSDIASKLYRAAMAQSRNPVFYEDYRVPDHFDGRFDLFLVHLFLIMESFEAISDEGIKDLNQAIFDVTFLNMDQVLREMGIGDMGIPKHMKRMMTAFNGRMNNYHASLNPSEAIDDVQPMPLKACVLKNVYGVVESEARDDLKVAADRLCAYIHENLQALQGQGLEMQSSGAVSFVDP